jgi:hypothetical protein
MDTDRHAEARDRKREKRKAFVPDNRRSVRTIEELILGMGKKYNKPKRGGVRELNIPEETDDA